MLLLKETGLSPEALVRYIPVSNSTYRRWLKSPPHTEFPKEYEAAVAAGVYKLLNGKVLAFDSVHVNAFIKGHLPEYFQAVTSQLESSKDSYAKDCTHEDRILMVLSNLGNSDHIRKDIKRSDKKILKFSEWGNAWKSRIQLLTKILPSKQLSYAEKAVAYGALAYLLWMFDLTPDSIPLFGYVDDFGIISLSTAYYAKRFPQLAEGLELIG
jgi:uncharacterized membrane protein YkvA (DUF1232 family)